MSGWAVKPDWEPIAETIADVAGPEALAALQRFCGGQRVVMPTVKRLRKVGEDHWLAVALGWETALKVADLFPMGDEVQIPLGECSAFVMRRKRLREELMKGGSANAIARAVGCHRRTVFYEKAKMKQEGLL